jgi:hypothetical protein
MSNSEGSTAHARAVQAISEARQHVRRYRFELERATVPEDQIFIGSDDPNHPQKNAHAALMDYYEEVAQSEYIRKYGDTWLEELTDAAGNEIEIEVPKKRVVEMTVDEENIDSLVPSLDNLETKVETPNLERLRYRWAGRQVTIKATVDSPYRQEDTITRTRRLWMPPKLMKAAYSQLNDALSQVNLLAQTSAPVDYDPDPI